MGGRGVIQANSVRTGWFGAWRVRCLGASVPAERRAKGVPPHFGPYFDESASNLLPDHAPARYGYAVTLAMDGDITNAEKLLRALIADRPDLADAHATLGTILSDTGREQEGRRHLERALELRPGHPQALQQLQRLNGGQ